MPCFPLVITLVIGCNERVEVVLVKGCNLTPPYSPSGSKLSVSYSSNICVTPRPPIMIWQQTAPPEYGVETMLLTCSVAPFVIAVKLGWLFHKSPI